MNNTVAKHNLSRFIITLSDYFYAIDVILFYTFVAIGCCVSSRMLFTWRVFMIPSIKNDRLSNNGNTFSVWSPSIYHHL